MSTTRREFLRSGALLATGLVLELSVDGRLRLAGDALAATGAPSRFRPFAWLAIEPTGHTVITVGRVEMGQGVRTALPMIVAEELDADWSRVEVETAMPGPDFQRMTTSGSWSVGGSFEPLRKMGARARAMLIAAAASRWSVDVSSCRTESGRVLHPATKRSLGYGELADAASRLPVPELAGGRHPAAARWQWRRPPRSRTPPRGRCRSRPTRRAAARSGSATSTA